MCHMPETGCGVKRKMRTQLEKPQAEWLDSRYMLETHDNE
jgi:hypothetical protein